MFDWDCLFLTTAMQITFDLSGIQDAAASFWAYAQNFHVITFTGGLGAGKTTFISALCKHIGIQEKASSPTFALINEYTFEEAGKMHYIRHMDWYRLESIEEAIQAGMEDALIQKEGYCFIEWPEKAWELVPEDALQVSISVIDENTRLLQTN
jgi:tRNA threonylcarbamoyladenosine biosynthesis protein TsaE